jgi:hypothetical protein
MLTCKEWNEDIQAFLARELAQTRCSSFIGHLAACPRCADGLKLYELTIRLARQLPRIPPPESLLERFRVAFWLTL